MKLDRKIIAFCLLILFIIFALVIIIIEKKQNKSMDENQILVQQISIVENKNSFFAVKNIILAYINSVTELNLKKSDINILEENYNYDTDKYIQDKKEYAKNKIFNQLAIKEKEEYNITFDNIEEKIKNIEKGKYYIKEMNYIQETENISIYFIKGEYITNNQENEMNYIVVLDKKNMTFEIYDNEYFEKNNYNNLKIGDKVKFGINEIQLNEYNTFKFKNISDEDMILEYITIYKENIENNIEKAYEMIEEEYRNKRFQTIDKFKKYINENYENIFSNGIEKYYISNKNDYVQYVCIDGNNNYYIIKEMGIMNYKILLDMYTINTEEFSRNYAQASTQRKVAYNIEKFISSLEEKNYYYAYNVLSEEFKNNYFKKQKEFEDYIKKKVFEDNIIEYKTYKNEDEINVYEIILRDTNSTKENKMTIIMKLLENEEYVMSFTVE